MPHPTPRARQTPISKKLIPGQNGTKRYLRQFGDALVCVRYRHDPDTLKRYTTVEIIVDERTLPGLPHPIGITQDEIVAVRIDFHEDDLRTRAKHAGAKWDADLKIWRMPFHIAQKLGLQGRVKRMKKGDD